MLSNDFKNRMQGTGFMPLWKLQGHDLADIKLDEGHDGQEDPGPMHPTQNMQQVTSHRKLSGSSAYCPCAEPRFTVGISRIKPRSLSVVASSFQRTSVMRPAPSLEPPQR